MHDSSKHPELGRLLFKKGPQAGTAVLGIFIIGLALLVCAGGLIDKNPAMKIAGPIISLFMALMGVLFVRLGFKVHYLYEDGIASGKTTLRFDEIESYSRENVQIGTAGIHTQTNITLVFVPFEHTRKPTIRFVWQAGRKGDSQIDEFHERIVAAIADRMQRQLEKEDRVSWTGSLAFRGEGLEHASRTGVPVIVAYKDLAEPEFKRHPFNAEILIRHRNSSEVIGKMRTDAPNLLPGLALMEAMCANVHNRET